MRVKSNMKSIKWSWWVWASFYLKLTWWNNFILNRKFAGGNNSRLHHILSDFQIRRTRYKETFHMSDLRLLPITLSNMKRRFYWTFNPSSASSTRRAHPWWRRKDFSKSTLRLLWSKISKQIKLPFCFNRFSTQQKRVEIFKLNFGIIWCSHKNSFAQKIAIRLSLDFLSVPTIHHWKLYDSQLIPRGIKLFLVESCTLVSWRHIICLKVSRDAKNQLNKFLKL